MWLPSGVCVTSGWNCTPKTGSDLCLTAAIGQVAVLASEMKSSETRVDLVAVAHPDVEMLGHAGEQALGSRHVAAGRGHIRGPGTFSTLPPSISQASCMP